MAAAVFFTSSRGTLDWAAQQETPRWNVDDIEAVSDSVEINPPACVAPAEGETVDVVQNTTRGSGLELSRKIVKRFD